MRIISSIKKEISRFYFFNIMLELLSCYLSLHCLPIRPGKDFAMTDHFLLPCFSTSWIIRSSSCILNSSQSINLQIVQWHYTQNKKKMDSTSLVQAPLTSSGLRTFCQRWRHWTSVRSGNSSAGKAQPLSDKICIILNIFNRKVSDGYNSNLHSKKWITTHQILDSQEGHIEI